MRYNKKFIILDPIYPVVFSLYELKSNADTVFTVNDSDTCVCNPPTSVEQKDSLKSQGS